MDKVKTVGRTVLARFEEPSTWAGAGIGAMAIHGLLPGAAGNALLAFLGAAAALLAIVVPEKKA
jgi:hypothetical protein